ncbi:hypothetical protein J4408_03315 [Candidatus Pacearchaeota archaeon]|nr:hypothetical protein [Candidatus Pacearchaeota archaeon]
MKTIRRIEIDLTDLHDYVHEPRQWDERIRTKLKEENLLDDKFIYTIIDGDKINELVRKGTYRKGETIFAFTKDYLIWQASTDVDSTRFYADLYENSALSIWTKKGFEACYWDDQ